MRCTLVALFALAGLAAFCAAAPANQVAIAAVDTMAEVNTAVTDDGEQTPEEEFAPLDESAPEESEKPETIETFENSTETETEVNMTAAKGPKCADACTPKIDVKASVIEAYKRHRAQVAVIGDWGKCKAGSENKYSWRVDWGDEEVHSIKLPAIGPYQTTHTYAKKGKQTVEVTFCAQYGKCDEGCTTWSKVINVLP